MCYIRKSGRKIHVGSEDIDVVVYCFSQNKLSKIIKKQHLTSATSRSFTALTMPKDERKIVGGYVIAKVTHVRNDTWCRGRYGSEYKKAEVQGRILEVEKIKKNDKGPAQTYVTALFDFGDNETKSMKLHLTNLKPGIVPPTQQTPQIPTQCDPPVAAIGAEIDASNEASTTTVTTTD